MPVSPRDVEKEMGFAKGDSLNWTIAFLVPQVALWQMAKESGGEGEFLATTSSEVIDFIGERYFSVDRKDLSSFVSDFLWDAQEEEFNFGFSCQRPPQAEWPEGISPRERSYAIIRYPKSSTRLRFAYSLNPENLGKVAQAAQKLGGENSLRLLYEDGKRMWEEETESKLPDDHQTPEWFKNYWLDLYEAKDRRRTVELQTAIRNIWQDVKNYFDETEGDPKKDQSVGRSSALFDLVGTYWEQPLLSRATPSVVTSLDPQRERDSRVLTTAVSQADSYESFLEVVDKEVAQRMEKERGYRKTINEVYIELHDLPRKKRWREARKILIQAKYLDWDDQVSKEIFWDQAEIIERVEKYFKKNRNRQEALQAINEDEWLSGQEIEDLISFF